MSWLKRGRCSVLQNEAFHHWLKGGDLDFGDKCRRPQTISSRPKRLGQIILNISVVPSENLYLVMDPLELVSEEISPFCGSVDEIVLAISAHLSTFYPSEDSKLCSCSSNHLATTSNQKIYHSREPLSNPDAVKSLISRALKYHYWKTDKSRPEDQSTSNSM